MEPGSEKGKESASSGSGGKTSWISILSVLVAIAASVQAYITSREETATQVQLKHIEDSDKLYMQSVENTEEYRLQATKDADEKTITDLQGKNNDALQQLINQGSQEVAKTQSAASALQAAAGHEIALDNEHLSERSNSAELFQHLINDLGDPDKSRGALLALWTQFSKDQRDIIVPAALLVKDRNAQIANIQTLKALGQDGANLAKQAERLIGPEARKLVNQVYSGQIGKVLVRHLNAPELFGPSLRVTSKPGFSRVSATVDIPSSTGSSGGISYRDEDGDDTVYAYFSCVNVHDVSLDAGLMHNRGTDTWSPFIKLQKEAISLGATPNVRLKPGQSIHITFAVLDAHHLKITATGQTIDVNSGFSLGPQTIMVEATDPDESWSVNGKNQFIERYFQIAQNRLNLNVRDFARIRWRDTEIGTTLDDMRSWDASATAGTFPFPPTVVTATGLGTNNEVDTISVGK